jgi:hypothetical protein
MACTYPFVSLLMRMVIRVSGLSFKPIFRALWRLLPMVWDSYTSDRFKAVTGL